VSSASLLAFVDKNLVLVAATVVEDDTDVGTRNRFATSREANNDGDDSAGEIIFLLLINVIASSTNRYVLKILCDAHHIL
jgi:hypothetical protein